TYAEKEGIIGLINKKGDWVIEPKFDKARAFVNGLAPVFVDGAWGYINTSGTLVVQPTYTDADVFSKDGLAPVKVDKEWGFINTKGELVIPAQYQITAGSFGGLFGGEDKGFIDGVARVRHKTSWGFIKTDGTVLGGKMYDRAELFQK